MSIDKLEFLNAYDISYNKIYIEKVESNVLNEYFNHIKKIKKQINEYDDELYNKFNIYRYIFNDLILSLNEYSYVFSNLENNELEEISEFFLEYSYYADDKEELKEAFNLLKKIKNGDVKNEIANKLIDIIEQNKTDDIAIVCAHDFSEFSEKNKYKLQRSVTFYNQNQLIKENKIFETLIFIGPPYLFKKYKNIFYGMKIYYIMFEFLGSYNFKNTIIHDNKEANSNLYKNTKVINNDVKELLKPVDYYIDLKEESNYKIDNILKSHRFSEKENQEKFSQGNLINFVSGKYFILGKNAKIRLIRLNISNILENELIVEKLKLNSLHSGDWILIKSETDENLIVNEAKKIIGEHKYYHYLENVKLYKKALLEKSTQFKNLEAFKNDLLKNGINLKDVNTLKTWITLETIKPKVLFEILDYLNFSDVSKKNIFNAAKEINKSHILAGKLILQKLSENIKNINYNDFFNDMAENKEYILETEDKGTFFIEEIEFIVEKPNEFLKKDMNKLF